jgi:hypothetical protein
MRPERLFHVSGFEVRTPASAEAFLADSALANRRKNR